MILRIIFSCIFLLTFPGCSQQRTSHEEALNYYGTLGKITSDENRQFDALLEETKQAILDCRERTPQKLDSLELNSIKKDFDRFSSRMKKDIHILQDLKEMDEELNLKVNSLRCIIFADSVMHLTMPEMIILFQNGLETITKEQSEMFSKLEEIAKKQEGQRTRVSEISVEFMRRYDIKYEEVQKYGL